MRNFGFKTPTVIVFAALILGVVTVVVVPDLLGYGIIDDAYISLRYAANLAKGEGLVFNLGIWVEGYTNLLWTLALALGMRLGIDGPQLAVGLGQLCAVATMGITLLLHRRVATVDSNRIHGCVPASESWSLVALPLALVVSPTFLAYSVSGLETTGFAFLLTLHTFFFLGTERGVGRPWVLVIAGLILFLANLMRPEAVVVFVFDVVAMGTLFLIECRADRPRTVTVAGILGFIGFFAIPLFTFLLWRYSTFGYWLPNTFYTKVGGPTVMLFERGVVYAVAMGLRTLLLPAVLLGLFAAWRRADERLVFLSLLSLALLVVVALEGGDHMALWRFGLPLLPFSVVLVSLGFGALVEKRCSPVLQTLVVVTVFAAAGVWTAQSVLHHGISEHRRAQIEVELAEDWALFGRWLVRFADPGDSIALLPIGAIGYYSGLTVIDQVGLVDEHIAHLPVPTGRGYSGHEKFDNAYVLSRTPSFLLGSHLVTLRRPISQDQYDASPFFDVHRDLLSRTRLHRAYRFRCIRGGGGVFFAFYERRRTD